MANDPLDFEYFFTSAFEKDGMANAQMNTHGQSVDEVLKQINFFENWIMTLIQAVKAWEVAMKEKEQLLPAQSVMYSLSVTENNLFLYIYVVTPGAAGQPVIKRQIHRLAMKEYLIKLRDTVEYMRPYLQAADTIKLLNP